MRGARVAAAQVLRLLILYIALRCTLKSPGWRASVWRASLVSTCTRQFKRGRGSTHPDQIQQCPSKPACGQTESRRHMSCCRCPWLQAIIQAGGVMHVPSDLWTASD